ncbi:ARL14 effector protein isoform X3 [Callorhinchus milii]|uniref:ARL14 effector protein isoform X3 n=1 Tax=Callorhinchus milii TaxID=7868 RepID=UPI001C3FDA62|nr:ARL14 effector protein isoform X3 [Callorhinchus milii]
MDKEPPPSAAAAAAAESSAKKPDAAIITAASSASAATAAAIIVTATAPSAAAVSSSSYSSSAGHKNGQKAQKPPGRQARTSKALKSLQFANPGRQIIEFTPETSRREKRKLQTKQPHQSIADRQTMPPKSKVYDAQGLLIFSGLDLCDCLDEDCLGCFYPCPRCASQKCGVECRCDRKWLYEQIEIEGGEIIRNKNVS